MVNLKNNEDLHKLDIDAQMLQLVELAHLDPLGADQSLRSNLQRNLIQPRQVNQV